MTTLPMEYEDAALEFAANILRTGAASYEGDSDADDRALRRAARFLDSQRAPACNVIALRDAYNAWAEPNKPDRPATADVAALLMAAPVGTCVGGGQWVPDLTVASRTPGVEGPRGVLLTEDGRPGTFSAWCRNTERCKASDDWLYYEHWSARGREGHGYLCKECRHLVQSG